MAYHYKYRMGRRWSRRGTRLAAEMKMDQDAFIVSVCDSEARNPFDGL